MKVALVHDYLIQYGGAERVLESIGEVFPDAPIFTLLYDERLTGGAFKNRTVITSALQHIPLAKRNHRFFPLLMPFFIEQFDLSAFDVVLSDSSGYAKGILTKPDTVHIDYCHTPLRYAWDDSHRYIQEFPYPGVIKRAIPFLMNYLRVWDAQAAERVDVMLANSTFVSRRIHKYYRKPATVIHPPVDTDLFTIEGEKSDYFLGVGRMVPYKKFDLLIDAFNANGLPLKLVGDGPDRARLERRAQKNIEFVGLLGNTALKKMYNEARAFLFPQVEDFGIVAIESLSCGTPVVAFYEGGIREIVQDGINGIFFNEQSPESLNAALNTFVRVTFDRRRVRETALRFDIREFRRAVAQAVDYAYRSRH